MQLIELVPDAVMDAAETHRQSLKKPPKSIEEFLGSHEAQDLPKFVTAMRTLYSEQLK
jgi:hypothetical protein